jgi:hypothetical protein
MLDKEKHVKIGLSKFNFGMICLKIKQFLVQDCLLGEIYI